MDMPGWAVTLMVGCLGVGTGLLGQALYWGRFEGRVLTRLDASDDKHDASARDRSNIWNRIDDHHTRIARVEERCNIHHGDK